MKYYKTMFGLPSLAYHQYLLETASCAQLGNGVHDISVYALTKRALDVVIALIGLLILIILLPIIALCVLCEDHGPIFYQQVRVGRFCQPFTVYKLRSMTIDADYYLEQHTHLLSEWRKAGKLLRDPRITRVGMLLRRTSLDELPQMLNVLRGEMSLVGPRPMQHTEMAVFGELVELRQSVKPGLTGLWQVCGRSIVGYEQRTLLDCAYVLHRSFWLDITILLRTFPVVLRGSGAY